MRVLVTGADGFVGHHLRAVFCACGDDVVPVYGPGPSPPADGAFRIDVRNVDAVAKAVSDARPDAIVHLAAVSSVASSHRDPSEAIAVNVVGTTNVLSAARNLDTLPRVLLVSSGEVYGPTAPGERAAEDSPLSPVSPYAASKVAMEVIGFQFARSYGMHIVCARPFNHLGAGQSPAFAIPSFAAQIVAMRESPDHRTLSVGNLEPIRDFSHVRDVVAAYRILLEHGVSGEAYNVCSGQGLTLRDILSMLVTLAGVELTIRVDPLRLRPADIAALVGDATKIRSLGWMPKGTLHETLKDVLDDADDRRRAGRGA